MVIISKKLAMRYSTQISNPPKMSQRIFNRMFMQQIYIEVPSSERMGNLFLLNDNNI